MMKKLSIKIMAPHTITIYDVVFKRAKEWCFVLLIACVSFVANASTGDERQSVQSADDSLSLQDQKRNFLRRLSESTLVGENNDKGLSVSALLEYAKAAFVLNDFDKAEELSREVINTLELQQQSSLHMRDALLLNYKSLLWKESPVNLLANKKAKIIRNKRLAPLAYKRLMQYSYNNFEKIAHYQVLENIALFMFELPIFARHSDMAKWPISQKSFRANYTKAITSLSIEGRYATPNKILQKLETLPDYAFAEPMKAYYYLGRNALVKHRFAIAEAHFTKVTHYLSLNNVDSVYQYMAKDYLYHLHLRRNDHIAKNTQWLRFKGIKPTVVFQPELVVSDDISKADVAGKVVDLILSVSREGHVEHVELFEDTTASNQQVYMLVKDMMLRSRLSPTFDDKGELIATQVKLRLQVSPDIASVEFKKKEKLGVVLSEFYPGAARNQKIFIQRIYRQ
jgi:hypothetical protein